MALLFSTGLPADFGLLAFAAEGSPLLLRLAEDPELFFATAFLGAVAFLGLAFFAPAFLGEAFFAEDFFAEDVPPAFFAPPFFVAVFLHR